MLSSQTFNNTTLSGGATMTISAGSGTSTTLNLGTITRNAGSTLNFPNAPSVAPFNAITTIVNANTATSILGGWAIINSNDWAVSAGTGSVAGAVTGLSNGAGYTIDTWAAGNNVDVMSSHTSDALQANSIRFNQNAANVVALSSVSAGSPNVLASGGILVTSAVGTAGSGISGGFLSASPATDLVVNQYSGQPFTISSAIVDVAAIGLTKSGGGTLVLSGANTYSGQTTINGGVLSVASDGNLGNGGAIAINGGTLLASASFPLNASRGITIAGSSSFNNTPPAAIAVASTFTMSYGGTITNPAGNNFVIGSGSNNGTLILSGASTYAGFTTVNVGTLQAGATNAFSANSYYNVISGASVVLGGFSQSIGSLTGSGNIFDNSVNNVTLTIGNDNNTPIPAYSGFISDGANGGLLAVNKIGTGTLKLSGANKFTGGLTITGGSVIAGAGGVLTSTAPLTVGASGMFVLNGSTETVGALTGSGTIVDNNNTGNTLVVGNDNGNSTFAGILANNSTNYGIGAGALALNKFGTGTFTLSGTSNIYTGTTSVSAGTLQAGAINAMSPYSAVSPATGATFALNGFNQIVGSLTGGNGNVTDNSNTSVTLTIGTDNTSPSFSGVISNTTNGSTGIVSLTKVGRGSQAISGANTYTGQTTITAGTLNANGNNTIPAASVVSVGPNGTFLVSGSRKASPRSPVPALSP